jgi:hypothetical protein
MEPPHKIMGCQVTLHGTMSRGRSDGPRKPQIIQCIQQFDRAGL